GWGGGGGGGGAGVGDRALFGSSGGKGHGAAGQSRKPGHKHTTHEQRTLWRDFRLGRGDHQFRRPSRGELGTAGRGNGPAAAAGPDRKSTRLNSSPGSTPSPAFS